MNNGESMQLRFVPLLLIPSGCAALIYQVTWVRLLGLSMGSTSASVSTVLTAFFLGLAIGSYFAEKISRGTRAGLTAFVVVEMVIITSFDNRIKLDLPALDLLTLSFDLFVFAVIGIRLSVAFDRLRLVGLHCVFLSCTR